MSDFVSKTVFGLNDATAGKKELLVESSKYVQTCKCAEPSCDVILAWNAAGADEEDLEFRALSCVCGEEKYYTLCCSAHKNVYICPECK